MYRINAKYKTMLIDAIKPLLFHYDEKLELFFIVYKLHRIFFLLTR